MKSIYTMPPTLEAVCSIRPQGLPKYTFSAYWPIWAISTGESLFSKYSPFIMRPISTSKAAELERPEPGSTVELILASKPPMGQPRCTKAAETPRTRATVVFFSASCSSR